MDINTLNDDDFLQYARLVGRGNMTLREFTELCSKIKNRCNSMGYTWERGCCGTNRIVKIQYANKK